MRQPQWDKLETVLLIEAYWKIKAAPSQRAAIVAALSDSLRERAPFQIDNTFRNINGINLRLSELDYLFTEGQIGLKNTSRLFREMVELYRTDRVKYEEILLEAKGVTSSLSIQMLFCEWLQEKAPKLNPEETCHLLSLGEKYCKKIGVLERPLFETTDLDTIKKYVKTVTNNKIFRIRTKKQYQAVVNAANWYYSFIYNLPKVCIPKLIDGKQENGTLNCSGTQHEFDNEFYNWLCIIEGMAVPTCRSEGITKADICAQLSNYNSNFPHHKAVKKAM